MRIKADVIRVDERGFGRMVEEEFELDDDHPIAQLFIKGDISYLSTDGEEVFDDEEEG